MDEVVWTPEPEQAAKTNVARLMRKLDCADINQLREFSTTRIGPFWDAVVEDLDVRFNRPYSKTFDDSAGVEWTTWFTDGRINLTTACVDRWRDDPETAGLTALIAETEAGEVTELTFAELASEVPGADGFACAMAVDGVLALDLSAKEPKAMRVSLSRGTLA